MNPLVLLMLLSVIGAAALFVALAVYLVLIARALESIGEHPKTYGEPASYLGKIRLGVRAIQTQTDALPGAVVKLNGTLTAIRDGLRVIDADLGGTLTAVGRQEAR